MNAIDLMSQEHENILLFTDVLRRACYKILEGNAPEDADFRKMIVFARTYADKHHHGKEEQFLFTEMTEHLGQAAVNLVRHGMLVEHDLGRFHMSELEKALDGYAESKSMADLLGIVSNAATWADLLGRHIAKENEVAYPFARRSLTPEVQQRIDARAADFEMREASGREAALDILHQLRKKYL